GMLYSAPIIKAVAIFLRKKSYPLVVDPVCVAHGGARLLEEDAVSAMVEQVFPHADLLTPNLPEAEMFSGLRIVSAKDVARAAAGLLDLGPKAVLIKGGHMESVMATDWFVSRGGKPIPFIQPRVRTENVHGTGCALSAAIATGLGQGLELTAAIRRAQGYLNSALRTGFRLGKGGGPPNHIAPLHKELARSRILDDLDAAGQRLCAVAGLGRLIPEVRMNLALALPQAEGIDDVAAFSGRITCTRKGLVIVAGRPEFGASSHMAKVVLAARRVCPEVSCAANIRFNDRTLAGLDRLGLERAWFDRAEEPGRIKDLEGGTLEWGTYEALRRHPRAEAVKAVCDPGEKGKEPMIRLLARDTQELVDLVARLSAVLEGRGE
ncbi:MAG: PfkB family carbohydrate kinase, partial [Desulfovibrionaceae bacterium]|nr:PfkB family carbohydrate kinase [Desulfovibrionaceae bacterium]